MEEALLSVNECEGLTHISEPLSESVRRVDTWEIASHLLVQVSLAILQSQYAVLLRLRRRRRYLRKVLGVASVLISSNSSASLGSRPVAACATDPRGRFCVDLVAIPLDYARVLKTR